MLTNKGSITIRLNIELLQWLKKITAKNGSNISDTIRDIILIHKKLEEVPENLQYSELMLMQGAKSAMMAYRLMARFVQTFDNGQKIVDSAYEFAKENDFENFRIQPLTSKKPIDKINE